MNSNKDRIYTDKQIDYLLKFMKIDVDSREQNNKHIIDYFKYNKIMYNEKKTVPYGDYQVRILKNDIIQRECHIKEIAIERKNSIEEITQNLGKHRDRFLNEFDRADVASAKVFLFIEVDPIAFMCKCREVCTLQQLHANSDKCIKCSKEYSHNWINLYENFYEKIEYGRFNSQMNKKSLLGSLNSFNIKFDLSIEYVPRNYMGKRIYDIFYYYLKNRLKKARK